MSRSRHSKLVRALQEAHAAAEEAARTGRPIDEVSAMRAERRALVLAQKREAVEAYRDAIGRCRENSSPENEAAKTIALENVKRVGRRSFLAGAAAAMLAATLRPRRAFAGGGKQPRIAIVGGGIAGLRCAHMLWTKYGWRSTVYEAADRVGGRIETMTGYFQNNLVAEMHGEYISSEHASMLNLVKRYNLGLDDTRAYAPGTVDTYWVNGARYPQSQLDADWQGWAWQLFNNAVRTVPWPQTYNNSNATGRQWDQMNIVQWLNQYAQGGSTSNFGAMVQQSMIDEYGGDPTDQSALNLTMILGYNDSANGRAYQSQTTPMIAGTDERWHTTGGNEQVIDGLVGELPSGTIQMQQQLVALKANSGGTYTLTLQSGSQTTTVTADSVVLALPFKLLRNVDLSQAGLSALKMTAINTLGMGTNAKVMMEFNGEPWIQDGFTGTTYQDNGFISSGWQMAQNPALGDYQTPTSIWTTFPGGSYTQRIINAYNLSASSGVPPAKMITDTLAQLEPVLPGVTAAYTGRAWYDFGLIDQFVQGGYSYWRVGQNTSFGGYEGVAEGKIHFAGEHTSHDFQGFMEGGCTTGERCATEIHTNGG
jgi:monoamine oxidase